MNVGAGIDLLVAITLIYQNRFCRTGSGQDGDVDSTKLGQVRLALEGGEAAVNTPIPPMYPGGLRVGDEEQARVLETLHEKRLFRYYGPGEAPSQVEAFEQEFAQQMGVAHALAVSSGSMALMAALAALGVGPGDEVIVPAYTWVSSAASAYALGAVPVIAEVDESLTLDAESLEERITPRTRAIVVVHMRGAPADMNALMELAGRRGVSVLEDVAQACGGAYRGQRLGTIGDIGIFSFQYNKIITAGEGGAVITNSRRLYERAMMFHDVAAGLRSDVEEQKRFVATTARMSELHGAVARAQLAKLDAILADMRTNRAAILDNTSSAAADAGITWRRQNDAEGDTCLALIPLFADSDSAARAAEALAAEGVPAHRLFSKENPDYHMAYHWEPLIKMEAWSERTPWDLNPSARQLDPADCPKSWEVLQRAVNIDISPDLTPVNVEEISNGITKVLRSV